MIRDEYCSLKNEENGCDPHRSNPRTARHVEPAAPRSRTRPVFPANPQVWSTARRSPTASRTTSIPETARSYCAASPRSSTPLMITFRNQSQPWRYLSAVVFNCSLQCHDEKYNKSMSQLAGLHGDHDAPTRLRPGPPPYLRTHSVNTNNATRGALYLKDSTPIAASPTTAQRQPHTARRRPDDPRGGRAS